MHRLVTAHGTQLGATPFGKRSRRADGIKRMLSVIVCTYDMPREAPRTILSSGVPYQKDIEVGDYEVIVVDNGSKRRLPAAARAQLPPGVSLVEAPDPRPSPASAMNWAARELARGDILMFAIDGARIFSDRLFATALSAHAFVDGAFVYTLGWHLGPKVQKISVAEGYDATTEDRLLAESGWPERPGALYDISVFASSCARGFFGPISESNAFSVPRNLFERFGGYDERYVSPGGGLCNLEIFARYVTRPGARNVCLLSEGTFHQTHGGITTSGKLGWDDFQSEHREIFGRKYKRPSYKRLYFGAVRPEASRFFAQSIDAV